MAEHNRWGIHWSNIPIDERLTNFALSMCGDCYLVIDGAWGIIPKIRAVRPNAVIVHRHAVADWMNMKPKEWAFQMAELYDNNQEFTPHVELECEPDIFPNFPGWGQPIIDRLKFAAQWNKEAALHLREFCPGVIIHSPPLAHERVELNQWFEIWEPLLDVCDVLDMHCYWEKDGQYYSPGLYNPEESLYRAFRYRLIHNFLESQSYHIPMMVTECGNFAPDKPDYADQLAYYFSELEGDASYMIGGCVFILKSNEANRVNDLTRQPNIQNFFYQLGLKPKAVLPYPPNRKEEPMSLQELPEGQIHALDVSEWGGPIKDEQWKQAYDAGFRMAIVQAWGGGPIPGGANKYCAQQLAGARMAGMDVAIYLIVPSDTTTLTHSLIQAGKDAAGDEYQHIKFYALDIEGDKLLHPTDPVARLLNTALNVSDKPVVIYSSKYMWEVVMGGAYNVGFEKYPLWDARYDELPDIDATWFPYGGWTQRAIKQYKGTTTVAGGISADLNIVHLGRLFGIAEPEEDWKELYQILLMDHQGQEEELELVNAKYEAVAKEAEEYGTTLVAIAKLTREALE